MTLFIAKKGNKWLTTGDPDVTMLENGEVPTGITDIMKKKENKMNPMYRIGNSAFKFPVEDDAGEAEIHVLVAVPGIELPIIGSTNKNPHPTRKRRWDELNEILDDKKGKIEDDESSMVYSDVSFEDVDKIMPADHYKQKSKDIGDDKIDAITHISSS